MARDRFVEIGPGRFRCREWGEPEAPVVVLLHGVLLRAEPYGLIAERIAAGGHHVMALDQRGHGTSPRTGEYGWQAFVDDLAALWSALDVGSVDVVGHSMGGQNAARFAAQHPAAVRRLVMVDCPFSFDPAPDAPKFWQAVASLPSEFASPDEFIEAALAAFPRAKLDALRLHATLLVEGDGSRFTWQDPPDLAVVVREAPSAEQDAELCRRVACPAMLIRAEHSELVTPNAQAQIVAAFADCTGVDLPGSGHMVQWENPEGVADLALAFLS